MSEMKHTPGPWAHESKKGPHNVEGTVSSMGVFSVSRFNDFMEEEDANECDAIDASWVCGIWGEISDEDEANASLIAAAPKLLEALVLFVRAEKMARDGNPPQDADELIEIGESAIAKAEGRT